MRYLPHTEADIQAMLAAVGVAAIDDLFAQVPGECRRRRPLNLPPALSEWDLDRHMEHLAGLTATSPAYKLFLGAGSYDHHIPETIKQLLRRGEFFTAYTPYQPEVSQGTLQAIYEYQTLVGRLLGMEVANASMYDGASALAEALLMAIRVTKRRRVALSRAVHPHYRQVVETYLRPAGFEIVVLAFGADGRTDLSSLANTADLAAVAVQSPNFFGCVEDLKAVAAATHAQAGTLMITAFSEPLAYGLFQAPGRLGADIVCGEGQSLGIPRSFGGPGVGLFACRQEHLRSMPGRLVGRTVDQEGRRGFVLTLSTREQHIRRERATSNICTNQGLCALAAAMYMASLGGSGLRELARLNYDTAGYLKNALHSAGIALPFSAPTFNEFVVRLPAGSQNRYQELLKRQIVFGLHLAKYFPELSDHYLLCATETSRKQDMDLLVQEVTR
jgi:glycine dehydrogenase subunit 1